MLTVICYDIADDRRRSRVARLLEGHGERAQESVFECHLDSSSLHRLKSAIDHLIDPHADRVRYYRLCGRDAALVVWHGSGSAPADQTDFVI